MQLGIHSFGNTPRTADGGHGPTAQAVRDVLEAVRLAEEVGLDFFGFGEHHTRGMPLSSPTSLVTAAAAQTERIDHQDAHRSPGERRRSVRPREDLRANGSGRPMTSG